MRIKLGGLGTKTVGRGVVALAAVLLCLSNVAGAQEKPAPRPADELTGDWGGARPWLAARGITLKPRLTQFYQGLAAGDDDHGFEYGGKADLAIGADLGKLGLWKGLSFSVHAEYNFGNSVNGRDGTMVPTNAALYFPGMEGAAAFDLSSVYLVQTFGRSTSVVLGKVNMIDVASSTPFMGGAGIDAFWNMTFVAPPSGTVPPYLFGALITVRTDPATYGVWIYDPNSVVNKTGFEDPFADGVTFRGSVSVPVTLAGLGGHQGLVALYSTEDGTDLSGPGDLILPPADPGSVPIKNSRYYFAYSFDQALYQSKANPKERVGVFGQVGVSDGNPNPLHWSVFGGVGGTGLVPRRSRDNWGAAYYYDSLSQYLVKGMLPGYATVGTEYAFEIFYDLTLTPWLALGADLQVVKPVAKDDTAVFPGIRMVIRL